MCPAAPEAAPEHTQDPESNKPGRPDTWHNYDSITKFKILVRFKKVMLIADIHISPTLLATSFIKFTPEGTERVLCNQIEFELKF